MKVLFSPGSLITIAGAALTVIGGVAYLTGAANLSVPTLFYGFPIFLGGLALKTSELPPAIRITPPGLFKDEREKAPEELSKLISDVTRWRYGQKAHLESSLKVLNLWDENCAPQLIEIEEILRNNNYGLRLKFNIGEVTLQRWEEKKARLGRFFAKDLEAEILLSSDNKSEIDLILLPKENLPSNESNSS